MSHKTRHDTSFHHQESHKISLLEDIKTNTNSINLNVDTLEVNTDTLETKIAETNTKLDTFSGESNNTTGIGDGSTQLRVVPLGYNQSAGQVRSLLVDSQGHLQTDVVSTALPTGAATEATLLATKNALFTDPSGTGNTAGENLSALNTNIITQNGKIDNTNTALNTINNNALSIATTNVSIDGKITACNFTIYTYICCCY